MLVLGLAFTATGAAAAAPSPAAAKTAKLKVLNKGQKKIKRQKAVRVKLKGATLDRKLKLRAKSKTFDTRKFKNLTKKGVLRPGARTVRLKLNQAGREQIRSCEWRQIRVQGKGAKVKWDLRRNTGKCRPRPIDLSRASTCDFIRPTGGARVAVHAAVPQRLPHGPRQVGRTGRRVPFQDASMPQNVLGPADRRRRLQPQRRLQPGADDRGQGPGARHARGARGDRPGRRLPARPLQASARRRSS